MSGAAVLFDLDDTLYPERTFVDAAMRDVATTLTLRAGRTIPYWHQTLLDVLDTQGRGTVFDTVLAVHDLPTEWVPMLVHVYRAAAPPLELYPDATTLLKVLSSAGFRLGVVTDGLAVVQANKIASLGLRRWMDAIVLTGALPAGCAKPSPVAFRVTADLLNVSPTRAAYVANDASKDFQGPAELGMTTVFVTRAARGLGAKSGDTAADVVVESLAEALTPLQSLLDNNGA